MENVGLFYDHLEYLNDIWEILWPSGTICTRFFGNIYREKSSNHDAAFHQKTDNEALIKIFISECQGN
jgi:hypothetical protein